MPDNYEGLTMVWGGLDYWGSARKLTVKVPTGTYDDQIEVEAYIRTDKTLVEQTHVKLYIKGEQMQDSDFKASEHQWEESDTWVALTAEGIDALIYTLLAIKENKL